ncbi:hypothetical protein GWK47_018308 [Chionoecetes opilio]|uniref:Uncharacterized protein n=1 Tax=Chionoecetes opilio TaxID=41210 RepID=A0A8J4XRS3_CHIOP|nr:hypothetical protein GWK47_018308 [Chionoecetes opilio]
MDPHPKPPAVGAGIPAGTVLETRDPGSTWCGLDGSGPTTIRNRHHLRPLTCVQAHDDGTTAMPGATHPAKEGLNATDRHHATCWTTC